MDNLIGEPMGGKFQIQSTVDRGGCGHIGLVVEAGRTYISPIWSFDRAEELVYPVEIPNGYK